MTGLQQMMAVSAFLLLAGCSGTVDLSCDDVALYQTAQQGAKLRVPEDLDPLNPTREMPIPDASPQAARPAGSDCLDLPPT